MIVQKKSLKREEILRLAALAKLMIEDGDNYSLNDMATDKELLAFAKLVEEKLSQFLDSEMDGAQ